MEPQRVVQARPDHASRSPDLPVYRQHRVQQGQVGGVGQRAGVQQRIVGQLAVDAHPDPLVHVRCPVAGPHPAGLADVPGVDRSRDARPDAQPLRVPGQPVGHGRQLLGRGYVGGRWSLVVQPLLDPVERGRHQEDRQVVLVGHGPADRERAPVADVLHLVPDRHGRIARPDEVPVQRVHEPGRVDSTPGRHQRLPGHLPAEDPLLPDRRALPLEVVRAQPPQVEQRQQLVDGRLPGDYPGHAKSVIEPSWCTRSVLVEPGVPGGLPATITT